jgi:hypothetical protein
MSAFRVPPSRAEKSRHASATASCEDRTGAIINLQIAFAAAEVFGTCGKQMSRGRTAAF